MRNPKTIPERPPKPVPHDGWVQKSDLDDYLDRHLPIPTQVVSNEEYYPLPQTTEQKAVEYQLLQMATRNAKKLGLDRRQFLRTACGTATAFAALNQVFGDFFRVEAAELFEPAAAAGAKVDYFIFDVQTHHVAAGKWQLLGVNFLEFRRTGRTWNPELRKRDPKPEDLYLENYIKEVFLDSDTDVAAISGIPGLTEEMHILPPDQMVKTRNVMNRLTRSSRMVSHGLISPDLGTQNQERMQVQVEKLKIDAWKGYTDQGLGETRTAGGWTMRRSLIPRSNTRVGSR